MGLDILLKTDNYETLYQAQRSFNREHSLSRTFCNLMCRQNVIHHDPELDQLGKITAINISPIYDMESHPDNSGLSFLLDAAENEEEKKEILREMEENQAEFKENIELILTTVSGLIDKLNQIDDIPALLEPTDRDTLDNYEYFANFTTDTGDGYIGNNFGQDLRNFKRFLEFAKANGATTVWFSYG